MNPNPFLGLLHSRKFWLAMLALVQTVVFQFFPQFPQEMWLSINAVLVIVIAGITIEDAAEKSATIIYEAPIEKPEQEEGLG